MRVSDWSSDVCSSDLFEHPFNCFERHRCVFEGAHRAARGYGVCNNHSNFLMLDTEFCGLLNQRLGRTPTPPVGRGSHARPVNLPERRSEEHTSELQSLMRISYAVSCLKKKNTH